MDNDHGYRTETPVDKAIRLFTQEIVAARKLARLRQTYREIEDALMKAEDDYTQAVLNRMDAQKEAENV